MEKKNQSLEPWHLRFSRLKIIKTVFFIFSVYFTDFKLCIFRLVLRSRDLGTAFSLLPKQITKMAIKLGLQEHVCQKIK